MQNTFSDSTFRQSENQLRAIIDGQPNGIVMIDREGAIVLVNAQLLRDFRYQREELIGQSVELLLPDRFRNQHPLLREGYFADPTPRAMGAGRDLFGLRKDGTEFPVELGLNPVQTDEGTFVLGSVVDITERRKTENELEAKRREVAESEERFRRILDGQPNGMVMIDRSGTIVMVNAQLERDFGYTRDEMIGQPIELLVPTRFHADHPTYRSQFFNNPQTRAMGAGRDLFGTRKDGSEFLVELGLNPISIGEEMFVVGSVVDITERKAAEEKLKTLDELKVLANTLEMRNRDIRVLLDGVEQGFFTITPDGVMSEERSGALDRWFGAPDPGMTLPEFIAQFDPEVATWIELGLDQFASQIMPAECSVAQLPSRFSHGLKTFAIDYTPIHIEELPYLAVVVRDITPEVQKEKLEAQQREILAIVSRIAQDRSGFLEFFREADGLVHALLNNREDELARVKRRIHTLKGNSSIFGLTRIESICHGMEKHITEEGLAPRGKDWNKLEEAWKSVQSHVQSVVGFKRNVMELSEAEYNGMLVDVLSGKSLSDLALRLASWKLETTARYLNRVAEQARALAERLEKGDIVVVTHDQGLRIEPDNWSEFWSSFIHLVRNAVDHGLETENERLQLGKSEKGKIELTTEVVGDRFEIAIRDNGRGIDWDHISRLASEKGLPTENQDDLVDALFCDGLSTASTITTTSGRGIGMMAVKSSCEALGGRIAIRSELGRGTEFRFSFPVETMAPHTTELLHINQAEALQAWQTDVVSSS